MYIPHDSKYHAIKRKVHHMWTTIVGSKFGVTQMWAEDLNLMIWYELVSVIFRL